MKPWNPKLPRGFPLTVSNRGYVVTVGGRTRWVCGKRTPHEALAIYDRKVPAWRQNETPLPETPVAPETATLHYVLTKWILDCRGNAQRGQIRAGTFQQYKLSAKRIDAIAGQVLISRYSPDTTKAIYEKLHERFGADAARRSIGHLRACAHEAEERGWCQPVKIGRKTIAKLASRPAVKMRWRLYTPAEVRSILWAVTVRIREARGDVYRSAWVQLKAMILLALNGGYGARELSQLPRSVVDLDGQRIDYERGKTGASHIVPLWPETVRALRRVLRQRQDDSLVFRTRAGNPWCRETRVLRAGKLVRSINNDNVAWAFNQIVKPLGLKIAGSSFYKLRHLFATTADKFQDRNAVSLLMGHSLGVKAHYIRVDEARLRAVVEYVRQNLILLRSSI